MALLLVVALPASAQTRADQRKVKDVAGRTHTLEKRVTPAERKAAAQRLKAKVEKAKAGKAKAKPSAQAPSEAGASAPLAVPVLRELAKLALGAAPAGGYLVGPNKQLVPDYSGLTANWAYSPILPKFVDPLPGLYIPGVSPACVPGSKYIPVAQPQPSPVAGEACPGPKCTDYYEIELAEYTTWPFHSGMPTTKLRGYAQTNATDPCVDGVHSYLGPLLLAQKDRPVRIKFTNRLPTGAAGNLSVPVDPTVMGSGPGPNVSDATRLAIPADVLCMPDANGVIPAACYTQNRATIHLHGGVTPWISDGTTHQWITPAGETTNYKEGVSVYNVPDMANPGKPGSVTNPSGSGVQTFYYKNDQSARLMFYHDHASGITRLNVYVGEAAGYLLRDSAEAGLETAGLIPGLLENIPLVIQEKGFVDATTIDATDPTWNWGTGAAANYTDRLGKTMSKRAPRTGDLWWPHVYMPAQNPADLSGYNAMGRWNYGPWFFPPTPIPYGPVTNPYYDCDVGQPCTRPEQPFEIPGTPNPSWGAEAFLDTPVINGTAYPKLTVQAKPYRFRILNAGGDRFFNLQWYVAADKLTATAVGAVGPAPVLCDGTTGVPVERCTEVKMVPASPNNVPPLPANWPQDGREGGVPDPLTAGPSFVMIGSEGGFLPKPVVVPPQPVVWNGDPLTFNFGNVSDFSLLLGPAERADAIVDFSGMAGKTFILYSDAPAAFPALDPRNDYYTGNPDQTDTGGTIPTLPGMGPNTRTLMQVTVVAATGTPTPFNLTALETAFATAPGGPKGVFAASQDDIVVGQSAYDSAYGKTFPSTYPWWGLGTIFTSDVKFETVSGQRVTVAAEEKAIHDEMGATFDDYGRMRASLGLAMPNPTPNTANFIMQGYADPPTELVPLVATPIGNPMADGTQIWRLNHNGVDTHPIHFHLFNVQVINRVGWDGAYRLPSPQELGWKDTVRVSPLEDTYVALRPIVPKPGSLPFDLPNSFRPLEPSLPIGSTLAFTNIDPLGNPITPGLTNQIANFGWEYVWHCHILSHEENDMMRAIVYAVPPTSPTGLTATPSGASVVLAWTDTSPRTSGFVVERATDAGFTTGLTTNTLGLVTTFTDSTVARGQPYFYRVTALNTVGSAVPNYPTLTVNSAPSTTATATLPALAAPTNLTATLATNPLRVNLSWTDNATTETGFVIERCTGAGCTNFAQVATRAARAGTGITTFTQNLAAGTYVYRVKAVQGAASSAYTNTVTVVASAPAAPTNLTGAAVRIPGNILQDRVTLNWVDASNNETGFQIQRSLTSTFTNATTYAVGANTTTFSQNVSRLVTYYYRVRATNGVGNSAWSNVRLVSTP